MTNEIEIIQSSELAAVSFAPVAYPPSKQAATVYISSLSEGSRRTMLGALNDIAELATGGLCNAEDMPWGELRIEHTEAIRSQLAERYSYATANKHLSALRGALKRAWRLNQMDTDSYYRAIDLDRVKGEKPPQAEGRQIVRAEIIAIMGACAADGSARGVRDAAIIAIAYAAGLRRSEIANLGMTDYNQVECKITVTGKRNKTRNIYISASACEVLGKWLSVRGDADGAIFLTINKGGNMSDKGMSQQSVYDVIKQRVDDAGITNPIEPHDFRRTYIGELLDNGVDISTAQKLAGHSNANTTAGYDRRGERAKKKASQVIDVPIVK